MNQHNESIRRSPRLVSKGYYHPQEPRSQLISYKEPVARTFNTRKRKSKVCRVLLDESIRSDIENNEPGEILLPSDSLYQEDDTSPDVSALLLSLLGCSSVVRRKILLVLFFLLIGFGICFSYMCASKFLAQLAERSLHKTDTLNHGPLYKEIESLKEGVNEFRLKYKKEIESLKQGVNEFRLKYKDYEIQVHRALSRHRADDVGMADFALESLGATVKSSSETLKTKYCSLFGIGYWCQNKGPETVLQPEIHPGTCWPFNGSKGHLVIDLPCPIRITHVTLQHLPRVLSPTNKINSAPKDFAVYGLDNNNESKILGVFTYDQDGEPIQTFKLADCPSEAFQQVQLRILSNWGHEYTCVYRFRLHSQPNCTSKSSRENKENT